MSLLGLDDPELAPEIWGDDEGEDAAFWSGEAFAEPELESLPPEDLDQVHAFPCSTPEREPSARLDHVTPSASLLPVLPSGSSPDSSSSQSTSTPPPKRLRFKQPAPVDRVGSGRGIIEGFAAESHPACRRFQNSKPDVRRLTAKRLLEGKYRLMQKLKQNGEVEFFWKMISQQNNNDLAGVLDRVGELYFDGIARDSTRPVLERGYAMTQCAATAGSHREVPGEGRELRVGASPSVLLTYIGPFGIIDAASVPLPGEPRPGRGHFWRSAR